MAVFYYGSSTLCSVYTADQINSIVPIAKSADRMQSMACTRLLLERYSIILDSHTTSTQLTTRSLFEHTDLDRIPSRSVHEQLDNTRFLHEQYPANERRLDLRTFSKERIQGQCACVRSGSDRVHSSSDRVCSSSDRLRSGRDRVKSKGIGYGSRSDRIRSYRDRLDLDIGLIMNCIDRVNIG